MKLLIENELSFVSEDIVTIHEIENILKKYSVPLCLAFGAYW